MSVFFEYPTDVSAAGKGSVVCSGFSHSDHPILAVSSSNGDLTLFHEEGETITVELHTVNGQLPDNASPLPASFSRPSSACGVLSWHPHSAVLACGWRDGCVSLWAEKERSLREDATAHKADITLLLWSPDGTRLLTGDARGALCVWSVDPRMRLTCVSRYDKSAATTTSAITHAAFRQSAAGLLHRAASSVCPPFFFGGSSGAVWYADDSQHCSEVAHVGQPLRMLHSSASKDYLAVVTEDATLLRYRWADEGGGMQQDRKVKLSIKGDGSELRLAIAGHGLLAAANAEGCVRFWHLESDDSYLLLFDGKHMAAPKDVITCIDFNPRKRVLCGGTAAGRIVFWRYVGQQQHTSEPSEADWEGLPAMESSAPIQHIQWGPGEGLLGLHNSENVSIVLETVMQYKEVQGVAAVQLTADSVMVQRGEEGKPARFSTNIRVKGLDLSADYLLVWNGKRAEVRDIRDRNNVQLVSSFNSKASACAIHGEGIYCAVSGRLELCNLQGAVQSVITFTESEGHPVALSVSGDYLAVATSTCTLKLWDVSKAEARLIVPGHRVLEGEAGLLITALRINCNGSRVSLATRCVDSAGIQVADTRVHVYDVEVDRVFSHQMGPSHYPAIHCWDASEPRLLTVESKQVESLALSNPSAAAASMSAGSDTSETVDHNTADVTTLWVTSDHGVLMQDSFTIDPHNDTLLALAVPHFMFLARPVEDPTGEFAPRVRLRPMRDFIGLETVDADTKADLLAFSFHLTTGNLDEAYRCVKRISSEHIWANIAQQCVKTKRLDVAEVCLANMNNARGVKAVRVAKQQPEVEVAIAQVAIQLHMLDDAERLYRECGRFDLLCHFLQATGKWKEALAVAAKHDRVHLKALHHQYARHLEQLGDIQAATAHYESANTHRSEVPRMLHERGLTQDIQQYVTQHPDAQLLKWWAQLNESHGQLDAALDAYTRANDQLAVVRVLCQRGDVQQAVAVCKQTADAAACYHLARQMEADGEAERAISLYGQAGRHRHAIRLAKDNGLDALLLSAALQASDQDSKLDAAAYFEDKRYWEKAVMLYDRGGNLNKALDLCFQGQLFDALRAIADNLTDAADPVILAKCATYFLQHSQYEKAVQLFLTARQYQHALQLCTEHNIHLSDDMAERMTPPKPAEGAAGGDKARRERDSLLVSLAELLRDQGSYQLACKKFTQAGDSVSAIKCLIRSGDVEKVLYYANMSKKGDVYVLAANYAQTLDWRQDDNLIKHIVAFYQKAKANAPLSAFFEHCADVEIDEFRDYEKAVNALREAVKYVIKAKVADKEERVASLDRRIANIQQFVDARQLIKSDPPAMTRRCEELCEQAEVPGAVRHGDVYALLMEFHHSQHDDKQALAVIERMRARGIAVGPFLDANVVQSVYAANGMKAPSEEFKEEDEAQGAEEVVNEEVEG